MSVFNNKNTLEPLFGKLWITKPIDFSGGEKYQNINICFQSSDGEFIAIDYMRLEPDGTYYKKTNVWVESKTLHSINILRWNMAVL